MAKPELPTDSDEIKKLAALLSDLGEDTDQTLEELLEATKELPNAHIDPPVRVEKTDDFMEDAKETVKRHQEYDKTQTEFFKGNWGLASKAIGLLKRIEEVLPPTDDK